MLQYHREKARLENCFLLAAALAQEHETVMRVMKYAQQVPHLVQSKLAQIGYEKEAGSDTVTYFQAGV